MTMFSLYTDKLHRDVEAIKAAARMHEVIRAAVYDAAGTILRAHGLSDGLVHTVAALAPPHMDWRIYDHCACLTRLYALYERFVEDLLGEWLKTLPSLFSQYSELPETVRDAHRKGVADILVRLGGTQYKDMTEATVLRGISSGVLGTGGYELLKDAFFNYDSNLWPETMNTLFDHAGIPGAWHWVENHRFVQRFLRDVRGSGNTVVGELREFLKERNYAAHGEVSNVIAVAEFSNVADFIVAVCQSLRELVAKSAIERMLTTGEAVVVGTVFRRFGDNIRGIRMSAVGLDAGDRFYAIKATACFGVVAETIEVNNVRHDHLVLTGEENVGVRFTEGVAVGSRIVRLLQGTHGAAIGSAGIGA